MSRQRDKVRQFLVEARIGLSTSVEISAKSLEEAQERAKAMKLDDFIEFVGDNNDCNFAVCGVFELGGAPQV